ncbi:hypothetical protein AC244_02015 [Ensifer adhaerens]|uniref:Uncharacterized protein n=1 Tax=Ensifer adhaerens TaxID=106592 RepID=A0A0L8C5W2_ENSAD|nr:hypothetical protein AC244_02015 [Ensifer adhaerens]
MPQGGKDDVNKANDSRPIGKPVDDNKTFGEALSKIGFVPANVGRKIVSQGRRRETLKKSAPRDSDK